MLPAPRRIRLTNLLEPAAPATALALATVVAILAFATLLPRTRASGVFRVDEAHKVSETVALRLVLERRWNDPLWFRNIVDRTNPPFAKYAFGLGVLASGGTLPDAPSLSRLADVNAVMPMYAGAADAQPYVPLLEPCRRAALLACALAAAAVAWVTARMHGALGACIAAAFFARHWMITEFGTSALFDPILLCAITLTAIPVVMLARPRPDFVVAVIGGFLCAAAFQTRLNGGIALVALLAGLFVPAFTFRSRRHAIAAAIVSVVFAIASVAMNPYYWAAAPADASVPERIRDAKQLTRIPVRFAQQVHDLRTILDGVTRDGIRLPLWAASSPARPPVAWTLPARLRFVFIAVMDDALDCLLFLLAALGVSDVIRERKVGPLAILAWGTVILLVTVVWLPLPWARYLMPLLAPLAIAAGGGSAALLRRVVARLTADRAPA